MPTLAANGVDLIRRGVAVAIIDAPYGIDYRPRHPGSLPNKVVGDESTDLRDWFLKVWGDRPMACFAAWHQIPPRLPRIALIWDKGIGVGMGDLSLPWKTNYEVIWIYGDGWSGHRGSAVLRASTVVSWHSTAHARQHPTQKPMDLITQILAKAPDGAVIDPFMGVGTTLRAAKDLGRCAIGIEIEEPYCEIAAKRMEQEVLFSTTKEKK